MDKLAAQAEKYRSSGGIHSAAAGRNGELLLYSEDLGRHNTLDRIAGEALLRGMSLDGTMLATSGRVSTEMVAKSLLLGVDVIASRTSPTDMAVELCNRHGICLVGYVRGGKFTVYSHPEMIETTIDNGRIAGMTGVILAGGSSRRMGSNKALLKLDGMTMIEKVYQIVSSLFDDVVLVTNHPEEYSFIPCRKIPDIYQEYGSIAGLHAALTTTTTNRIFLAGCDMPLLNRELIRLLAQTSPEADAVVPLNSAGLLEPLHAVYAKSSLSAVSEMMEAGEKSILRLFDKITTTVLPPAAYAHLEQAESSFVNANTPGEFQALHDKR
jgi:Molybdopterin-guanine dinucleotide biosynthesis protein A